MSRGRGQRWMLWKNVDTSEQPVCPAFGHVEWAGYEFIGPQLVLHGRSSSAFDTDATPASIRGITSRIMFNGEVSVNPGEIGLATYDTPTWAAISLESTVYYGDAPDVPVTIHANPVFGSVLSSGLYEFFPNAPGPAVNRAYVGKRWKLGVILSDEFGLAYPYRIHYRNLHFDNSGPANFKKCFVGGLRTFTFSQDAPGRIISLPTTTTTTTSTTTSTTTTTTTTTTTEGPNPCGYAIWQWVSGAWYADPEVHCTNDCHPVMPSRDGAYEGEFVSADCEPSPDDPECLQGICLYQYLSETWVLYSMSWCATGCQCVAPEGPGDYDGEVRFPPCVSV